MARSAQKRCASCGAPNPARAKFCMECGRRFGEGGERAEQAALAALIGDLAARGIQASPQQIEAMERIMANAGEEYRQATSLIIDISGFTTLSQQRAIDEIKQFLNQFYRLASDAIMRNNGFIVKFLGDAVLAVFGAPAAFERDAESAVRAAMDIVKLTHDAQTPWGAPAASRAGLATGEILSGMTQKGAQSVFDIFGHAVNLSERLQKVAGPNEVVVDERTRELAAEAFQFQKLPPVELRHVEGKTRPWLVLAEKPKAGRRDAEALAFVGREKELESLDGAWKQTRESGESRAVAIVGEGGMGKTRLVREFIQRNHLSDSQWTHTRIPSRAYQPAFSALTGLFLHLAKAEDADSTSLATKRVRAHLRAVKAIQPREEPYLLAILGLADPRRTLPGVPAPHVRGTAVNLALRHLTALSASAPRVWQLDGGHWLDEASCEFLERMVEGGAPGWLVLLTQRPGGRAFAPGSSKWKTLKLGELPLRESMKLLAQAIDLRAWPSETVETALRRASGNPLFIEEFAGVIRQRQAGGALDAESLRLQAESLIPGNLQALAISRIDMLDRQSKEVLQIASAIGRRFSLPILRAVVAESADMDQAIRRLEQCEMTNAEERPGGQSAQYVFRRQLIQEVAYGTLPPTRRRELHARIAIEMERLHGADPEPLLADLAFHFERGGDKPKAAEYALKAARRQVSLASYRDALAHFRNAREMSAAAQSGEERERNLLAWILSGKVESLLGDSAAGLQTLRAAQKRYTGRKMPPKLLARLNFELGMAQLQRGEMAEAEARLKMAEKAYQAMKDRRGVILAWNALSMLRLNRGDPAGAARGAQEAIRRLGESAAGASKGDLGDLWNNLGLARWRLGKLAEADEAYREAVRARKEANDLFGLTATLANRGILAEERRQDQSAEKLYRQSSEMAERLGYRQMLTACEANLGNLALRRRRYDLALEHSQRSLEIAREIGDRRSEAIAWENLGLAQIGLRDFRAAASAFQQGRRLAERMSDQERIASLDLCRLEAALDSRNLAAARKLHTSLRDREAVRTIPDLKARANRLRGILEHESGDAAGALQTIRSAAAEAARSGLVDESRRCGELLRQWK